MVVLLVLHRQRRRHRHHLGKVMTVTCRGRSTTPPSATAAIGRSFLPGNGIIPGLRLRLSDEFWRGTSGPRRSVGREGVILLHLRLQLRLRLHLDQVLGESDPAAVRSHLVEGST